MFRLPIGDTFDTFVRGLKENLSGFFDTVSNILGFAITVLERILSLDPNGIYPSLIFGIVLAFAGYRLASRRLPRPQATAIGAAIAILFAGAEVWRINSLRSAIDAEEASAKAERSLALRDALIAEAPASIDPVNDLLTAVVAVIPDADDRENPAFDATRTVQRAQRSLRRATPDDFGTLSRAVNQIESAIAEIQSEIPRDLREQIDAMRQQYAAFTLMDELEELAEDYAEITAPELYIDFLNQRTYQRLSDLLADTREAFGDSVDPVLASVEADFRRLDPARLSAYGPLLTTILLVMIAALIAGNGIAAFSAIGFVLILSMNLWGPMIQTLALVLSATLFALLIGIPLGILAARSKVADQIIRPILDFMQTMPAFVYLIPAVIFFGLGPVPGAMATLIFAMPPAVRLTSLGIRQVPSEVVEAAQSFGATDSQLLLKAQIPIALPTILAGVNQTIMLALSMVVIGGMIGAGGLGEVVLSGITKMDLGLGFEGGLAVVVLAIFLDRVTQKLGASS